MEIKQISFEDWIEKYKPIRNPFNEKQTGDDEDFEINWSSLEENDLLDDNKGENRIWTLIQGDRDSLWLVSGYHRVNRLHHYITEMPYEEEIKIEYWEGYPEMTQKEVDTLKIIRKYMQSRDNPEYVETLDKVIAYVEKTSLN